jgi:UDP-3-O-[3-hydroxymyristoyl] glucosamine N-acyltransferase
MVFPINSKNVLNLIGDYLDYSIKEFEINRISTKKNYHNNSILFLPLVSDDILERIHFFNNILVVTEDKINYNGNYILVKKARLALSNFLSNFKEDDYKFDGNNLSFISKNTKLGRNVIIEPFVFIGKNVEIGDFSVIKTGAKVISNTKIGTNCIIRENSVIGGQGFGVEKDINQNNLKLFHIGGVIIGNYVEVGALTTVCSGTIDATIIEDYVKLDDHVHVAHNCMIGKNSVITGGVIIGGSVRIGQNCYLGTSCSIMNNISISHNTTIGIGSNVIRSIEFPDKTFLGNPAVEMTKFIKERTISKYIEKNQPLIEILINRDLVNSKK